MTIFGWDMSHYDAPSIGNAISQGISFMTHKAGGDATDQELDEWWANVKGLPESVILGAYWVLTPGSPASKARAFLARLDSVCKGWRDRDVFILQLDAEMWNQDPSTRPSIGECNTFCDTLNAAGKWEPVGYLPKWVYPDVSGFRYPVWASAYVSGSGGFKSLYPGDSSKKWAGYGKAVTILQYTSSATIGGQTTCDANAYRGTLDQLKSIVTPGWNAEEFMGFIDNQSDFNNAMNAWAGTSAGKTALATAVLNTDNVVASPDKTSDNKFWAAASFLQNTYLAATAARGYAATAAAKDGVGEDDVQAIVAGVLTGLPAADIAAAVSAALPADEAKKVADELAARLAA